MCVSDVSVCGVQDLQCLPIVDQCILESPQGKAVAVGMAAACICVHYPGLGEPTLQAIEGNYHIIMGIVGMQLLQAINSLHTEIVCTSAFINAEIISLSVKVSSIA